MSEFVQRLLACERKVEAYLRIITQLTIRIASLEQQLRDLRGS